MRLSFVFTYSNKCLLYGTYVPIGTLASRRSADTNEQTERQIS